MNTLPRLQSTLLAIAFALGLAPFGALAAKPGSVCIAPVPMATSGSKSLSNSTASATPYDFTVSFDGGKPIAISHTTPIKVSDLSLKSRHLVQIKQLGKPVTSFTFRFSGYGSNTLCLWFRPLYESWSLSPPGRMSWCRCAK